jgi:chlorite dismutase
MSTERESPNNAPRGSLRLAPNVDELEEHKRKLPRQFVNFIFYRALPEWRRLADADKADCKQRFINTVDDFRRDLLIHTYSTVGWRANADFLIWRIGYNLEPFQDMTSVINGTPMAKYLEATESFLSMTKRSMYIEKDCSDHEEDRTHVVPGT